MNSQSKLNISIEETKQHVKEIEEDDEQGKKESQTSKKNKGTIRQQFLRLLVQEGEKLLEEIEIKNKELRKIINVQNNRESEDVRPIEEIYPELQILRFLGRGSYGSVHECYEQKSKQSKALKILYHDKEESIQNLKEIAITSKISENYPDLISKIDIFESSYDKASGFHKTKILMDIGYCTLTTLAKAKYLLEQQWTETELLILLYKFSDAFLKLQHLGIAHRDIKTDNIMINEFVDKIKIIDVGEADYSNKNEKIEIQCVGSPAFAAPEILQLMEQQEKVQSEDEQTNKQKIYGNHIKSDIYSIAMTMIYFIHPKKFKQSYFIEYFNSTIQTQYPKLYKILVQMMSINQEDRQDFEILKEQCKNLLGDKVNQNILIDDQMKQKINDINIKGSENNDFEENQKLIEAYISLNKLYEANNIIKKLAQIKKINFYQKIALECCRVMLSYKSNQFHQILESLQILKNLVLASNIEKFQNDEKIRDTIIHCSNYILNSEKQELVQSSALLQSLTFKTLGKKIKINKELFQLHFKNVFQNILKQRTFLKENLECIISNNFKKLDNGLYEFEDKITSNENRQYQCLLESFHFDQLFELINKVEENFKQQKYYMQINFHQKLFYLTLQTLEVAQNNKFPQQNNILSVQQEFKQNQLRCIPQKNVIQIKLGSISHDDSICCVITIPNTDLIISSSRDQTIKVWDYKKLTCLSALIGHSDAVTTVAHIPNTNYIVSGSNDKLLKIWNYQSGECIKTLQGHNDCVNAVISIHNTKLLASISFDYGVKVWNYETEECLFNLYGHNTGVFAVATLQEVNQLASGDRNGKIKIWNYEHEFAMKTLEGHTKQINSLLLLSIPNQLASSSDDATIRIWNYQTGQCITTLKHHVAQVYQLILIPNTTNFASAGGEGMIAIYDYQSHYKVSSVPTASFSVNTIGIIEHEKVIVCGGNSKFLEIWNYDDTFEVNSFVRQDNQIYCIDLIPNTTLVASGCIDSTIKIWNYQSLELITILKGHKNSVKSLCVLDDSNLIASASFDQTIKVWDYINFLCLYTLTGHSEGVNSIAYLPRSKFIFSGAKDSTLKMWNFQTQECIHTFQLSERSRSILDVIIIPNTQLIGAYSSDNLIFVFNYETKEQIAQMDLNLGYIYSLIAIPQSNYMIVGGYHISILNYQTKEIVKVLQDGSGNSMIITISVIPEQNILAAGGQDHKVRIWNYQTGELIYCYTGHTLSVNCVKFLSDSKYIISCSNDETIQIWSYDDKICLKTLNGHENSVRCVAPIENTNYFLSGGSDFSIRLWDYESYECLHKFEGHEQAVNSIASILDTTLFVSGSCDSTIRVWDYESKKCVRTLNGHQYNIETLMYINQTKYIASGAEDCLIKLWNYETGECICTLNQHTSTVLKLVLIPNTKQIVSCSHDRTIKIWNYLTEQCIGTITDDETQYISAVVPIPNTKLIASSGQDTKIKIWNYEKGICISVLQGHYKNVQSLALIPDTNLIVSGSYDYTIKIWNYQSSECLYTLIGHDHFVTGVFIQPNTKYVVSSSDDYSIKIWDFEAYQTKVLVSSFFKPVNIQNQTSDELQVVSSNFLTKVKLTEKSVIFHTELIPLTIICCLILDNGVLIGYGLSPFLCLLDSLDNFNKITPFNGHQSSVLLLHYSNKLQLLFSGSRDNTIKLWNIKTQQCQQTIQIEHKPLALTVLDNHNILAYSNYQDFDIKLILIKKQEDIKHLEYHSSCVNNLCVTSYNNDYLISGSQDFLVVVWDVQKLQRIAIFDAVLSPITKLVVSNNGETLIIGYKKGCFALWNLKHFYSYQISATFPYFNQQPQSIEFFKLSGKNDLYISSYTPQIGFLHNCKMLNY